jgi:hypothetical protein
MNRPEPTGQKGCWLNIAGRKRSKRFTTFKAGGKQSRGLNEVATFLAQRPSGAKFRRVTIKSFWSRNQRFENWKMTQANS